MMYTDDEVENFTNDFIKSDDFNFDDLSEAQLRLIFFRLYSLENAKFTEYIIKTKSVNFFVFLLSTDQSMNNVYHQCKKSSDLMSNLVELYHKIQYNISNSVNGVNCPEITQFLIQENYDFDYLFEINDLQSLKYLLNRGLNFDVTKYPYLEMTYNFETFKYLHEICGLHLTNNLLFNQTNSQIIEYLLEQGLDPNYQINNEYFLASLSSNIYTVKIIELLIFNQVYKLDQNLLQLIYFNLIYLSDDDVYHLDWKKYIEIVYHKIDSFEVNDCNLMLKSDLFRIDISNYLCQVGVLKQILAKLKVGDDRINLKYFTNYETLKLALEHFNDLYTKEELNICYLDLFWNINDYYTSDELDDSLKMLKLLISYGAIPKIGLTRESFIKYYYIDQPSYSNSNIAKIAKLIINDLEFNE